jgi:hypothetical protein
MLIYILEFNFSVYANFAEIGSTHYLNQQMKLRTHGFLLYNEQQNIEFLKCCFLS